MASLPLNGAGFPLGANETLYCRNLPDKFQKDDLKRELYMLFTTYGPVLDIVALKTSKMRGQAHVLFRDRLASTQAMRHLNGQDFFGKQMQISFARSKSNTLAKLDGTFQEPAPPGDNNNNNNNKISAQRSVFAGPPGTQNQPPAPRSTIAPAPVPASETLGSPTHATDVTDAATPASQGLKRSRQESDQEDEDGAPMDMDDEAMDESDDD